MIKKTQLVVPHSHAVKIAQVLIFLYEQAWQVFAVFIVGNCQQNVIFCFVEIQSPQQILCIHLKRFRHELMFSTKISTHVSFPLEGLEMQPFLAKDCSAQTTTYDLLSVICHHGTASSKSFTPGRWS